MEDVENSNIEIRLLLEAIYQKYGYDFREYAWASIRRRILHSLQKSGLRNISEMQHHILIDAAFFEKLLLDLTVNVTEMFRDPEFYLALRKIVIPVLREFPSFNIWLAGCATGEEVYSMAILLQEEGVYERARIYATDVNEAVLKVAKEGIYPIDRMRGFTYNYQKGGGTEFFSEYYTARYDSAMMDNSLKSRIVFASHNLVTDSVFGEMQMIVCRNVLIYFNNSLRARVLGLFHDSLGRGGVLCLGPKEQLNFTEFADRFKDFGQAKKIYRRR